MSRSAGPIFLIGGGEMRTGETAAIDRAIRAAAPPGARFVFFPAAAGDHPGYVALVERAFGRRFRTRSIVTADGPRAARAALRSADVIYLGGGKTALLLKRFRAWGLLPALRAAHARGAVVVGMSAGAEALAAAYVVVTGARPAARRGWGLVPAAVVVHATARRNAVARRIPPRAGAVPLVCIGERAAVVVDNERMRKVGPGRWWTFPAVDSLRGR